MPSVRSCTLEGHPTKIVAIEGWEGRHIKAYLFPKSAGRCYDCEFVPPWYKGAHGFFGCRGPRMAICNKYNAIFVRQEKYENNKEFYLQRFEDADLNIRGGRKIGTDPASPFFEPENMEE